MSHVSIHLFLFRPSAWIIVWASPYLIEIDLSPSFLLENVGGERLSAQRSCFVLVLNTSQSKEI